MSTFSKKMTQDEIDKLADIILAQTGKSDLDALLNEVDFSRYQDDPVGFCEEVLGETLTDDVKVMLESVRDNVVTVAISGNAVGKTHAAARVAVWFYLCCPKVKVFTAAAPPLDNLKNLLWGEINSVVESHRELFKNHDRSFLDIRRGPEDYLIGVAIPSSSTDKEARFCTDASELFELTTGKLVTYLSLIGKKVDVVSVDPKFNKIKSKAEFFDNGIEDVYEVTLSTGHKLIRTGEHPLYAGEVARSYKTFGGTHVKGRCRIFEGGWTPTKSLESGMAVLCPQDTSFNFGNERMNGDEVKVMAYLIGDGYIGKKRSIQFFQEDNRQLADFRDAVSALGARTSDYNAKYYRVNVIGDGKVNPVLDLLRRHGLMGCTSTDKHVPDAINSSSRDCVALFLNRLWSTDGWACMCKIKGKYRKAEIGYGSNSERLIRDVQRLLLRFGISSTVRQKKTSWTHAGVKKYGMTWMCTICRSWDIIRFADQVGIYGKEDPLAKCVDYAKTRAACATWRVGERPGFVWDKVKSIKLLGERSTVGVHVPTTNTYLTNVVEHNSGKHRPYMLFVFDEGDAIPDEVYRGTDSCMSGGHVRLLIMFNPRKSSGAVYRMIKSEDASIVHLSAFNHPNVITGENRIEGAVTRDVTVDRINRWSRPFRDGDVESARSVFILPKHLIGVRAPRKNGTIWPPLEAGKYKIKNPALSYMVLGQYPAQGTDQLISEEWLSAARSRYDLYTSQHGDAPPVGATGVMGLDVAEMGEDSNVAVGRYGGYLTSFDPWGDVDTIVTGDKAVAWYKAHKGITRANVDATGVGTGVAPHMQKSEGVIATSIKVASKPTIKTELGEFRILRDELLWRVREWLRTNPGAMLPPDEELLEELMALTYDTDSGKVEVLETKEMKRILGRSPDRLMALAMTFAGAGGFFNDCDFQDFPDE